LAENNGLIRSYLSDVQDLLGTVSEEEIRSVIDLLKQAYEDDRQVFLLGNGGSAATASHMACDLQKTIGGSYSKRFRVLAVTDAIPIITAWANDTDYANVFAKQLATFVNPGDLVIAISGSGNSPNVIEAVNVANEKGAMTIGLTGYSGGKLAEIAAKSLIIRSNNMQQIEDVHMVLAHLMFTCLMKELV
jgi:D-sedoheptulose 7-phosphate isomerase